MFMVWAGEWIGAILVIWIFCVQVFMPLWRGAPLFPMFRKKEGKVLRQLKLVNEESEVLRLEGQLADKRKEVDKQRKRFQGEPK
jgi:hypothetical protein